MQQTLSEIVTSDGPCEVYVTHPDSPKFKLPTVLLYMDAVGVRPILLEMAKQIASQGYLVLLPNLFYRDSRLPIVDNYKDKMGPDDMKKAFEKFAPMMKALTPELLVKDARFYLDYLQQHEFADTTPSAIVGYCFGGGHGVRTAAAYPERVSLVASFHGGNLASDADSSPHLFLPKVKARLYFAHADNDKSMTPEQIARLETALDESHADYGSELYEGAAHGFTMRDLPAYDPKAADRHWSTLNRLLHET